MYQEGNSRIEFTIDMCPYKILPQEAGKNLSTFSSQLPESNPFYFTSKVHQTSQEFDDERLTDF